MAPWMYRQAPWNDLQSHVNEAASKNNNQLSMPTKRLFTWREEDPSTRKILEGGITLRWVYMQKFQPVSCPSREG